LKALVEADSDRILGFTAFGVGAAEIMTSVQIAMNAGLPYTALRDTILAHPTLVEGLIPSFSSAPSLPKSADTKAGRLKHIYPRNPRLLAKPSGAAASGNQSTQWLLVRCRSATQRSRASFQRRYLGSMSLPRMIRDANPQDCCHYGDRHLNTLVRLTIHLPRQADSGDAIRLTVRTNWMSPVRPRRADIPFQHRSHLFTPMKLPGFLTAPIDYRINDDSSCFEI
jgi:Pyridine nucleotide-disulphide oxidoreductase, dimerisation domain